MSKLAALLLACLALGSVAVGCGGDDDSGDGGGTGAATEETVPDESAGGGDGAEPDAGDDGAQGPRAQLDIDIVDIDYEPRAATVKRGVTVRWTNTGDLPHTVTKDSGPGAEFDSGTLEPGDTFEATFDEAGEIGYLCTIHAGQTGSLTVQ